LNYLEELETLLRKGRSPLPALFYIGLVMGIVMGPTVLIAATIPVVQEAVAEAEANPDLMVPFGLGMTVLLGIAVVEQWVKVRKNRKMLATFAEHPHRIAGVRKKDLEDGTTRFYLYQGEDAWARIRLEEGDARRLVGLLTAVPIIFSPYCITPISEGTVTCPRCGQDVTRDAPLEMTLADYRAADKNACGQCGAAIHHLALRCGACGEAQ
jgi:hypothetical protein